MILFLRAGLALTLALALAAPTQAKPPRPSPPNWPQAESDLKADPAIRFGVLPNGMRYAIRKQAIPPGQAALRLWLNAGSLMEGDSERGLAHFLEHMAFNGSKNVKEGEMVKILERLGLAFGADTNASTGFSETSYRLDLPRTDAVTLDTSLMLMAETAFEVSIAPDAVDRERGIVLSEERSRDSPGYRVLVSQLAFLYDGQRLPDRLPIGQIPTLRSAPASAIADFYHRWYRPERAVLVAVGDFDPDAMEARIRKAFGGWAARGPAPTAPDEGHPATRGPEAKLVVEPGVRQSLQIAWVRPPKLAPDTAAQRRSEFIEALGLAILNRRYSRIARAPDPPFLGAGAGRGELEDTADVTSIGVTSEPEKWREAMAAAEQEQRRIVTYGVSQAEVDRELAETRAGLRQAVAGAATRRPQELAGEILGSLADHEVVTSPEEDLALFEAWTKALSARTVSAALEGLFQGSGPLVFMATPRPVDGGDAALLAAFEAARAVAVAPPRSATAMAWPYLTFGAPGRAAATRTMDDLGVTMVTFENGVRLAVKPTAFRDDEVLVRVNVGNGMASLPKDVQSPFWISNAVIEGGLQKIDVEEMEQVLADKLYGARFSFTDEAFVLSGSTRTEDLPTQLQVLTAYMTEPGWREAAFVRIRNAGRTIHDQYESTPQGVVARDLPGLIHSGDRRWTFPQRAEIADSTLAQLKAAVAPAFHGGPIEVVVVGDITVDKAIEAVAATFGALLRRPDASPAPPAQRRVAYPAGRSQPVVLTHKGRADQALGYIGWGTTDYWTDPQQARVNGILRDVMRLRLTEQLREAQGVTYSPDVSASHSLVWTGFGYLAASIEAPPEKLPGFFDDVLKIAADLRTREIAADELGRAKTPRIEQLQRARVTNGYWLGELSGASTDPRRLDVIRETLPGLQKITAADVKRAAETWLNPDTAYRLMARPATP